MDGFAGINLGEAARIIHEQFLQHVEPLAAFSNIRDHEQYLGDPDLFITGIKAMFPNAAPQVAEARTAIEDALALKTSESIDSRRWAYGVAVAICEQNFNDSGLGALAKIEWDALSFETPEGRARWTTVTSMLEVMLAALEIAQHWPH